MPPLTIRYASALDAALVADLSRNTFFETFSASNTKENMDKFLNEQFTQEILMAEPGSPGNIFLLAFAGEHTAGYARLRENNNPVLLQGLQTLEISRLYSTKEFIGKGVGRSLMQKSIEEAKKREKPLIWLGVWEKNQRAIDFYTRWGFEKFDEHDFILGNDVQNDWLMKKHI